jgi:hypothetical protein
LEKWRKQAVESGPLSLMERKARLPRSGALKLDGEKEARLVALTCSQPPEGARSLDAAPAGRPVGGIGGGGCHQPRDGAADLKKKNRQPARVDDEDVREGVCNAWMFVEPLGGWRDVAVTDTRTGVDWARQVKLLADHPRYRRAERITLVCENLNTHMLASLCEGS